MTKKKSLDASLPQKRTLFSRIADFIKNRTSRKNKPKHNPAGQPLTENNISMADEDLFSKREREMTLRTYAQNKEELIKFYKNLGQGKEKIPPEMRQEEKTSVVLEDTERILEKQIIDLAKTATTLPKDALKTSVTRLTIAMFVLERTKKLRELVLERDSLDLYALFVSLRNAVQEMLAPAYYTKSYEEAIGEFLDIEALITACSELCDLTVPSITKISEMYKLKLAEKIEERGKK